MLLVIIGVTFQVADATTVSTLTSRFRSDIGESDSLRGRFTNTQARDLLTRATQTVCAITGELQSDTTITLVANQAEYRLPSVYQAISSIKIKRGINYVNLEQVDDTQFGVDVDGNLESATYPKKFMVFNDSLRIAPAMTAVKSTDKLYVNYFARVNTLDSAAQTTQLPQWTDQLVVAWAVYFANERNYTPDQREAARQGLTAWTDDVAGRFIKPQLQPQVQPKVTP